MTYSEDNIKDLYNLVSGNSLSNRQKDRFKNIKKDILVHTRGSVLEKIYKNFPNETKKAQEQVLNSYETITKGAVWKGIDNLSRIFLSTSFNLSASQPTLDYFNEENFYKKYTREWINTSVANDPNTVSVWVKNGDEYEHKFIETQFILHLEENEIAFIDVENSEYDLDVKQDEVFSCVKDNHCLASTYAADSYDWHKRKIIYISKEQYVEMQETGKDFDYVITPFKKDLEVAPYAYTGVTEVNKNIWHSPIEPFIAWGNLALLTFRGFINSFYLYAYPRLEEIEQKCTNCQGGRIDCNKCESMGSDCDSCEGTKLCDCNICQGTGRMSHQSLFNIYTKVIEEGDNTNYQSASFISPDTAIYEFLKKTPEDFLKQAEKALYVQDNEETGQAISAEAREKMFQSMYAWLQRIGSVFYLNLQHTIQLRQQMLGDFNQVSLEEPNSYAIPSEMEAHKILNEIVSGDSPIILKNSQVSNFVGKFFSESNPIQKVMMVLKQVDAFALYSTKDLEELGTFGDITEEDRFIHVYAYPTLTKMLQVDKELINQDIDTIVNRLNQELEKKKPTNTLQSRVAAQINNN